MEKERKNKEDMDIKKFTLLKHRTKIEKEFRKSRLSKEQKERRVPLTSVKDKLSPHYQEAKRWICAETLYNRAKCKEAKLRAQFLRNNKAKHVLDNAAYDQADVNTVLFVLRISRDWEGTKEGNEIFKTVRLHKPYYAVLMRASIENRALLYRIEPHVIVVRPSVEKLHFLLHTKAMVMVDGKRRRLEGNLIVEQNLGHLGILCIEDMMKEIVECGPHFDAVVKFIAPFHFQPDKLRKIPLRHLGIRGVFPTLEQMPFVFMESLQDETLQKREELIRRKLLKLKPRKIKTEHIPRQFELYTGPYKV